VFRPGLGYIAIGSDVCLRYEVCQAQNRVLKLDARRKQPKVSAEAAARTRDDDTIAEPCLTCAFGKASRRVRWVRESARAVAIGGVQIDGNPITPSVAGRAPAGEHEFVDPNAFRTAPARGVFDVGRLAGYVITNQIAPCPQVVREPNRPRLAPGHERRRHRTAIEDCEKQLENGLVGLATAG
jgi:hypothetical protein